MEIIVSLDQNNGIGKDGDLLAHLSPDLKRLRAMTTGNIIVMGSKTYMSFPRRPLPDRENLVLTSNPQNFPEVRCFTSLDSFLEYTENADKPIFVLGGANVYRQLLPYCTRLHITRILHSFDADVFFPDPDKLDGWKKTSEGTVIDTEKYLFRYDEYERI